MFFDKEQRDRLQAWLDTLQSWEGNVPEWAHGFHRLRINLSNDLDAELKAWRIKQDRVDMFAGRYQRLQELSMLMAALFEQVRQLEAELDTVEKLFGKDKTTSGYRAQRCKEWRDAVARAGGCERKPQYDTVKLELGQILHALKLHREALEVFGRADGLLAKLRQTANDDPETAALADELRQQREAMEGGSVSKGGIERVKDLCLPLEKLLNQPEPVERDLSFKVLGELRRWDGQLGTPTEAEHALTQRYNQLSSASRRDLPAFQALLREAEQLCEQRQRQGQDLRAEKLRGLEDLSNDLAYTGEIQPDIRDKLATLREDCWNSASANGHGDWMERFAEVDRRLGGIASNHEPALEKRLQERREALQAGLRETQRTPLRLEHRQHIDTLLGKLDQLAEAEGATQLIAALREANGLEQALATLNEQAGQAAADIWQGQQRLREANLGLQGHAKQTGIECQDLAEDIGALGEDSHDLDEALGRVSDLEARLAEIRQGFVSQCRMRGREQTAQIDALRAALHAVGCHDTEVPASVAPHEAGPCVAWLALQHGAIERLNRQIDAEISRLEAQCRNAQGRLAAPTQAMDAHEREQADELLAMLEAGVPTEASRLERLRGLADIAQACADFWERLEDEQRGLQDRRAALEQTLRTIAAEQLGRYCPEEWLHRADDLVQGIPKEPQALHAAQLGEAKALLDEIEKQARRQRAQQIHEQLGRLRREGHNHPDRASVETLLDEIHALGDENTMPLALRRKLQRTVDGIPARSRHGHI